MKKLHAARFLSLILALVLSLSLCPAALAADSPFSDIDSSHWAWDDVQECIDQGIVSGFTDGTFKPDSNVTDVQFVSMITRTFYASDVETAQESAPAGSPWYWANNKVAADKYLTSNMTIEEKAMNRYDMANVAKNVLTTIYQGFLPDSGVHVGLDPRLDNVPSQVNDWDSVPTNRTVAIKVCYATGVITGKTDGMFHGEQSMTRAQACAVIVRMLKLINGGTPNVPAQPQQPQTPQQPENPQQPEKPQTPETPEQTGTGLLANGQEATVENVQAILDEIKLEYPEGTSWGSRSTPGTNYYKDAPSSTAKNRDLGVMNATTSSSLGGNTSLQYGCGGFMAMVSERIFGKTGAPCRQLTNASQVRPGDILMVLNNGKVSHYAICLSSYKADTSGLWRVDIADAGGYNGYVCWENMKTVAASDGALTGSYRIYTRYPD